MTLFKNSKIADFNFNEFIKFSIFPELKFVIPAIRDEELLREFLFWILTSRSSLRYSDTETKSVRIDRIKYSAMKISRQILLMIGERNAKSLSDHDMLNVQSCAPRSLIIGLQIVIVIVIMINRDLAPVRLAVNACRERMRSRAKKRERES